VSSFDNIDHELLLRAVRKHVTCAWALLYIERWLKAPMQQEDGTIVERSRGTPQGGVVSPILANLFMHYAFDTWMTRRTPDLPWCRYADDGLVHCRSENEAQSIREALAARLGECDLELHPTKTKIVYCKDHRRKSKYETVSFDFLGFCFRPRSVKGPSQKMFCGYTPAVSKSALNAMRETIKGLKIRKRTEVTLDDIARELNPMVRGWVAYYGRYTRSALYPLARYLNQTLAAWLKRKYKRFHRRLGRARDFLAKIARENRRLFVHWQLGDGGALACWEPGEARASRPVLREAGGEIPPAYSPAGRCSGAGHRQDQDRPALGLSPRRAPACRRRSTGRAYMKDAAGQACAFCSFVYPFVRPRHPFVPTSRFRPPTRAEMVKDGRSLAATHRACP
jgi:hypothetical protein